MPSAAGRTILVTRATSGVGLEAARALAQTGGRDGAILQPWKEETHAPQGQDDRAAARLWDLAEHATA